MRQQRLSKTKKTSEFEDKVIEVRRVTRVVAGGKRFSFRTTVVVGNGRGKVAVGMAKGLDVVQSIQKAKREAEKNIFMVPLKNGATISYDVEGKYGASLVRLKPAKPGHGLIAGGPCRIVLEFAGVKDITAKILGRTKNKLTNAMATIEALKKLKTNEKLDNSK